MVSIKRRQKGKGAEDKKALCSTCLKARLPVNDKDIWTDFVWLANPAGQENSHCFIISLPYKNKIFFQPVRLYIFYNNLNRFPFFICALTQNASLVD